MIRTKHTPEQLFKPEHLNIIRSLAWSFHRTTGLDFEELFNEACFHYCRACEHYKGNKGTKFTTYLYPVIRSRLIDFSKSEMDWLNARQGYADQESQIPVYEYWNDLHSDIMEILDWIQAHDEELAGMAPKKARGMVKDHLREQGWAWPRIWNAFRNTKKTLSETEEGGIII